MLEEEAIEEMLSSRRGDVKKTGDPSTNPRWTYSPITMRTDHLDWSPGTSLRRRNSALANGVIGAPHRHPLYPSRLCHDSIGDDSYDPHDPFILSRRHTSIYIHQWHYDLMLFIELHLVRSSHIFVT